MMSKIFPVVINHNEYLLKITKRKNAKNITLKPNLKNKNPCISIPYYASYNKGIEFFKYHYRWFDLQLSKIGNNIDFTNLTELSIKGITYKIVYQTGKKNLIIAKDTTLFIISNTLEKDKIANNIIKYLKSEALHYFQQLSLLKANKLEVTFNKVSVSDSIGKWGSCSSQKNLKYSFRLIMAPNFIIDYVIAHEVAHLVEFNHSPQFWNVLYSIAPQTELAKNWLKTQGHKLY